jgi:hypothetical protein
VRQIELLTNEDVQKLLTAFKTVFATKEDLDQFKNEIRTDFSNLQSSVDAYAKEASAYFQEMVMLSQKVNMLEK